MKNRQRAGRGCKSYNQEEADVFSLKDKVAVVTGGNGGIGLGMARGLAAAGAVVVIAARNADKSRSPQKDISAVGPDAVVIAVDVTDQASVERLVRPTAERCGRLGSLPNEPGTT